MYRLLATKTTGNQYITLAHDILETPKWVH